LQFDVKLRCRFFLCLTHGFHLRFVLPALQGLILGLAVGNSFSPPSRDFRVIHAKCQATDSMNRAVSVRLILGIRAANAE